MPLQRLLRRARARWRLRELRNAIQDLAASELLWTPTAPAASLASTGPSLSDVDLPNGTTVPVVSLLPLYLTDDLDLTLHWRAIPTRRTSMSAASAGHTSDRAPRDGHHYILGLACGTPQPILLPPSAGTQASLGGSVDGQPVAGAEAFRAVGANRTSTRAALHAGKSRRRTQLTTSLARVAASSSAQGIGTVGEGASVARLSSGALAPAAGPAGDAVAAPGAGASAVDTQLLRYRVVVADVIRHDFSQHRSVVLDPRERRSAPDAHSEWPALDASQPPSQPVRRAGGDHHLQQLAQLSHGRFGRADHTCRGVVRVERDQAAAGSPVRSCWNSWVRGPL